jgi:hypothetical protein
MSKKYLASSSKFAPTSLFLEVQRECLFTLLQKDPSAYALVYKNLMHGRQYNDVKTSEFTDWILNHRDVVINAQIHRMLQKENEVTDEILEMNKKDLTRWMMNNIEDIDLGGYDYPKPPSRFAINPGGRLRCCLECFICIVYCCEKEKDTYEVLTQGED